MFLFSFEQIHLYSDGGLDISQCGKYTMLCAYLSYVRDKVFYLNIFRSSFIPIFLDPSVSFIRRKLHIDMCNIVRQPSDQECRQQGHTDGLFLSDIAQVT